MDFFKTDFITDGGIETELIHKYGIELRNFSAFEIVDEHNDILIEYYKSYLDLAVKYQKNFILESPTWRANLVQGRKLNYTEQEIVDINKSSIRLLKSLKKEYENRIDNIVISGCVGSLRDSYNPNIISIEDSEYFHSIQIGAFKEAGVDLITALTINNQNEALGIVKSSMKQNLPVIISFTTDSDGKLGYQTLDEAIDFIDRETNNYPLFYMINCTYPSHFINSLTGSSLTRIKGIRANASSKSHKELDNSDKLHDGDKNELSDLHVLLNNKIELKVVGGCCGTNSEHIDIICKKLYV